MAADPSDLCVVNDLKAWLNLAPNVINDDDLLQRLLTAVSVCMQNWMNRTIASDTYTETRDGNGSDSLVMPNRPITGVASVTVSGQAIPASPDGSAPGFVFGESAIYLIGHRFTQGRRNVKLVYTAGFTTVPHDLAQACIEQAAYRYRERSHIGQTSTGMGPEHISFSDRDFTPACKTLMSQYRNVVPL